jgi:hypothetical protein
MAIVCFEQFFENCRRSPHLCATFSKYRLCINFDYKFLAYILTDFFTNSSGHAGRTIGSCFYIGQMLSINWFSCWSAVDKTDYTNL